MSSQCKVIRVAALDKSILTEKRTTVHRSEAIDKTNRETDMNYEHQTHMNRQKDGETEK